MDLLQFWRNSPLFEPHPWVPGGHLQTILGRMQSPSKINLNTTSHQIELEDGEYTQLCVDTPHKPQPGRPVVMLLHGLGGCSESTYVVRMASKLSQLGIVSIRPNHRGCGAHDASSQAKIYHSGSTSDLLKMIQWTHSYFDKSPIAIIGYSLSGTIALNLAGQWGHRLTSDVDIHSLAAICPPMDLERSSQALCRPLNWIYDRYYTKYLLRHADERGWLTALDITSSQKKSMTLRKFDEWVTAPLGGFKNRSEYYQYCSPNRTLSQIQVPTVIIQAANDPIVPPDSYSTNLNNPLVTMRRESCGGHLGFIDRRKTQHGDYRWLDEQLVAWIQHVDKFDQNQAVPLHSFRDPVTSL